MLSTVTAKGQVTIPKEIRDILHLLPNGKVDFILEGERAIHVPVRTLKTLRGAVPALDGATIEAERLSAKKAVAKRASEE